MKKNDTAPAPERAFPSTRLWAATLVLGLGLMGCPGGSGEPDPDPDPPPTNPNPVYIADTCGTIAPSGLPTSSVREAPTRFEIGDLLTGRVAPGTGNAEHYWEVEIPAGYYLFVLDGSLTAGRNSNIGLEIVRYDSSGIEVDRVEGGNEIGPIYRASHFMYFPQDETWQFRVTAKFNEIHDYAFGIFPNGTAIPTPYFTECPDATPLPLGEEVTFTVGADEPWKWFSVDLELADYSFRADASQEDGVSSNIIYGLDSLDRLGEESRATTVIRVNEIDNRFISEGALAVGEAGRHYFRVYNGRKQLVIKLQVTKD